LVRRQRVKSALLVLLQELVWGNNRDPIFGNDDGYQSFKECLLDAAKRHGLLIHAYLLMTNHTHLLASPDATNSKPKTVAIEPRVGWRDVTPRLWIRRTKRNYKIREYMMANLKPFSIAIVSWGMLSLCPAMAVDLEAQSLNTVIADGVVQIGNHRYPLPPGEWTLIAKQVGTTTGDTVRQGVKTVRGYFVTLQGKTFKSGLLLWGTANSSALASSAGWIDDPCKRDDVLYKNILDKGFKYPDCLMVNHYVGHLKVNNGWLEDAARWVQTNQVSIPTTVLLSSR
jgi:hypothetical protein